MGVIEPLVIALPGSFRGCGADDVGNVGKFY